MGCSCGALRKLSYLEGTINEIIQYTFTDSCHITRRINTKV